MDTTKVTGLRKATNPDKIENYEHLDPSTKELIKAAIAARQFSYCPYSQFKVGAAFRTKCGRIFSGCNVESSTFTPSSCAERTALSKAVSEGFQEFAAGAVVAFQEDSMTTPCGVCRQFIMEFANEDVTLFITRDRTNGGEVAATEPVLCTTIYNLLPHGFRAFK